MLIDEGNLQSYIHVNRKAEPDDKYLFQLMFSEKETQLYYHNAAVIYVECMKAKAEVEITEDIDLEGEGYIRYLTVTVSGEEAIAKLLERFTNN